MTISEFTAIMGSGMALIGLGFSVFQLRKSLAERDMAREWAKHVPRPCILY